MARILICEDELVLCRSIARILTQGGHDVVATDGQGAVGALADQRFDLILTDIRMPAVNGFEILRLARTKNPVVPVIAMSGAAEIPDAVRAMHAGARDFLIKPFDTRTLEESIDNALAKSTTTAPVGPEETFEVRTHSGAARPLRVFLCHSSADKPAVRELAVRLTRAGVSVWLDERSLLPGQRWDEEIPKAVRNSDVVIVCVSTSSITKRGYIQKEILHAVDVAQEEPEGAIFLIPARLEQCRLPDRLRNYHWVSLFESTGFENLLRALKARSADLDGSTRL